MCDLYLGVGLNLRFLLHCLSFKNFVFITSKWPSVAASNMLHILCEVCCLSCFPKAHHQIWTPRFVLPSQWRVENILLTNHPRKHRFGVFLLQILKDSCTLVRMMSMTHVFQLAECWQRSNGDDASNHERTQKERCALICHSYVDTTCFVCGL